MAPERGFSFKPVAKVLDGLMTIIFMTVKGMVRETRTDTTGPTGSLAPERWWGHSGLQRRTDWLVFWFRVAGNRNTKEHHSSRWFEDTILYTSAYLLYSVGR